MEAVYLSKNKGGFLAIDALLAMLALSVMTMICFSVKNSEAAAHRVIEEKMTQISQRESEILSAIEMGCGLGCLTGADLH